MTEDDHKAIAAMVVEIMAKKIVSNPLTDEERHWVRLAIKKEGQSIEFRKSIIEKSMGGLIWSALLFVGYMVMEFLRAKGFRP